MILFLIFKRKNVSWFCHFFPFFSAFKYVLSDIKMLIHFHLLSLSDILELFSHYSIFIYFFLLFYFNVFSSNVNYGLFDQLSSNNFEVIDPV